MGFLDMFKKEKEIKRNSGEQYIPFSIIDTKKGSYEDFHSKLISSSTIMLVLGKRGSGKTALGMKMLENFNKKSKRKCYALGFEDTKLPRWIKRVEDVEQLSNNSIALLDEGARAFFSRESMKDSNKALSKIMTIARHKNISLVIITQNSGMIDLNVLRLADTLLLKEPSLLQSKFERKAMKDIYDKISPEFEKHKFRKDKVYVWDDDFEGLLSFGLPDFWNNNISTSFRNA